jgi:hypothetical protein
MCAFGRKAMTLIFGLLLSLLAAPVGSESEQALSRLAVIALAPLDGQAVVKLPSGTMCIVQQGEPIPGTHATVVQVLPDRLMVSYHTPASGDEVAWIYRLPAQSDFSRVIYLRHHATRPERERAPAP